MRGERHSLLQGARPSPPSSLTTGPFTLTLLFYPGEAQKIERVLTSFSQRYYAHNDDAFANEDTALILAFSIMMLHTDLHNPSNPRRMTLPEFVRNNRGIDDGGDLPEGMLTAIYERIRDTEFQCCVDHTKRVEDYEHRIAGSWKEPLAAPYRVFEMEARALDLYRRKEPKIKRHVTLLLFNDLLLVVQAARFDKRYILRHEVPLLGLRMKALKCNVPHAFELVDAEDKIVLRFAGDDAPRLAERLQRCLRLNTLYKNGLDVESSC